MQVLSILLGLLAIGLTWYITSLLTAYNAARKIGLPTYVTPVNPQSISWMILSIPLRPVFKRLLPSALFMRLEYSTYGFEARVRNGAYEKFGQSYVLVAPGKLELWTMDPEMVKTITTSKDLPNSDMTQKYLTVFGPNILSSKGEEWQRQRRIIAPVINESVSKNVWQEGMEQANDMLDSFTESKGSANGDAKGRVKNPNSTGITNEAIDGLRRIAINVLGAVGYGKPRRWGAEEETAPRGHKMNYMESLSTIINNTAVTVFVPPWLLCLPFFPPKVQNIGVASKEYPAHNRLLVANDRATADPTKNNLMSVIVRLSDQEKKQQEQQKQSQNSRSRLYLSEDEIYGNLFLFTIAGFDTTSNTMAYALTLLAMHPELQDWIIEEIDRAAPTTDDAPAYDKTFPQLKRVLALMFETLRLYTPVQHLARTAALPVTLTSSAGTKHHIPQHADVFVAASMVHTNPEVWGPDPLTFRPKRWITTDEKGVELLFEPAKGTFLPWSMGPRYCPGMKMSQVEFSSVFFTLFRRARVEPALVGGATMEQAKEKLERILLGSRPLVTMQIMQPKEVVLRWVRRD